jgi:hypothetical protein
MVLENRCGLFSRYVAEEAASIFQRPYNLLTSRNNEK